MCGAGLKEYHEYLNTQDWNEYEEENENSEDIKKMEVEPFLLRAFNRKKNIVAGQKFTFNSLPSQGVFSVGVSEIFTNSSSHDTVSILINKDSCTLYELLKYELPFGIYFFLRICWRQIHILISSFYYSKNEQAAQNAFFFAYDLLHNFS